MYVACVIRGLCSSAGRWSYGVVSPVTGRVRPLTRSTARRPARWADSHIDMYVACVIRGLCSSAGRWSYGVVSPVTGRVR
ncbi:hypothetical protein CBL24_27690, partial [Shigella flexneri]